MRVVLEVEDLAKSFGGAPLFQNLCFRAEPGLLAVSGRNGSGKSTLLKILAGLVRPTRGHVRLRGGGEILPRERWRAAVGWAAPEIEFLPELTAVENLALLGGPEGAPPERAAELLERLRLPAGGRSFGSFSSGMKQRVRLAFSLLHDPPVLLWDEPFATLDVDGEAAARELLAARRAGTTVVIASNDRRDFEGADGEVRLS